MLATKTLATAAAIAAFATIALTSQGVDAGTITLFEHTDHRGRMYTTDVWSAEYCISFGCFNDIASSARWHGLTPGYNVYFYTDPKCEGEVRGWPVTAPDQPSNFVLDGINDRVSSVMVAKDPNGAYNGSGWACFERGNTSELATGANTTASPGPAAEGH